MALKANGNVQPQGAIAYSACNRVSNKSGCTVQAILFDQYYARQKIVALGRQPHVCSTT